MPGMTNLTAINITDLEFIMNSSSLPEMMIRANWQLYGGLFYFLMLLTLWLILVIVAYKVDRNNVLRDIMYSGAVVSILSFLLRAVYVVIGGVRYGLLTDTQLWVFPLVTILIAAYLYATKNN